MSKKFVLVSLLSLAITVCARQPQQPQSSKPLTKQQLIALVAGQSLPENIIAEIRTLGVAFSPDATYVELLKTAAAPQKVLDAIAAARSTPSTAGNSGNAAALGHLAAAGRSINNGQLDVASKELNLALPAGADRDCVGFIGGLLFIQKDQWQKAHEVYTEIANNDPDFPQLHTRLSATAFHRQDYPETLREAKAALRQIPTDPAAHLNAGLALTYLGKTDAAKLELQAAIENKLDYLIAYGGLAYLFEQEGNHDAAIAQFKKALALRPSDTHNRYGLGLAYMNKEDWASAIREFRIVKSQDPQNLEARQNLGSCLLHVDPLAAVTEFKELVAISPSYNVCHDCLGAALAQSRRYPEAEKEFATAIELDPAAANPHLNLGLVLEAEEKYDQSLSEFRRAEQLDPDDPRAPTSAGRVLLAKKDYPTAIAILKHAEQLSPADWQSRDLRGEALEASGDLDAAIIEFSEAVSCAPKELRARLDLARAQEKRSDWVAALGNYHQAADNELLVKPSPTAAAIDAENKYKAALARYKEYVADLRASGNEKQAAELESRLSAANSSVGSGDQYQAAMLAGIRAVKEHQWPEAESAFKQARDVAEKIHPMDSRLPEVYGKLGGLYFSQGNHQDAETAYRRQLALYEQLYHPDSPLLLPALNDLGYILYAEKRFPEARAVFTRGVEISSASFGENSHDVEKSLTSVTHTLLAERNFLDAETTAQRAVKVAEAMYGPDDDRVVTAVSSLCMVYDVMRNPAKAEPCHARMITLEEKEYGPTSPRLAMELNSEAQVLRQLGRTSEAASVEERARSLQHRSQQQPQ